MNNFNLFQFFLGSAILEMCIAFIMYFIILFGGPHRFNWRFSWSDEIIKIPNCVFQFTFWGSINTFILIVIGATIV